jgi:hypothetical protein
MQVVSLFQTHGHQHLTSAGRLHPSSTSKNWLKTPRQYRRLEFRDAKCRHLVSTSLVSKSRSLVSTWMRRKYRLPVSQLFKCLISVPLCKTNPPDSLFHSCLTVARPMSDVQPPNLVDAAGRWWCWRGAHHRLRRKATRVQTAVISSVGIMIAY